MIDEDKLENTAEQPTDTSEDKQVMTNEATAETMNSNVEGTETNTQAEVTNQPNQATAAEENSAAAQTAQMTETDYQQVLSELTEQIESLKVQVEERNSQYVRIAADFDNFRKRSQKDKEDLEQQVKRNTILELLPVVDNFERARSQIKPQTEAEMTIHKSYQGVYKQMVDCLKRLGVSPMRPEGQEFDPSLHEAVMRQPTNEHPEGTVLEELVRGYFLGEGEARRVLRHAMVKVAAPEEVPETSTADPANAPE